MNILKENSVLDHIQSPTHLRGRKEHVCLNKTHLILGYQSLVECLWLRLSSLSAELLNTPANFQRLSGQFSSWEAGCELGAVALSLMQLPFNSTKALTLPYVCHYLSPW
jgi:hypothetical protein